MGRALTIGGVFLLSRDPAQGRASSRGSRTRRAT
jgi:hypothetical protein